MNTVTNCNAFVPQFEASEKKGVITAYAIGGILAFLFSEYLIHIPVFDVLLGFPIQLLGLIMTPYLGVRYLVDKKDFVEDTGKAFVSPVANACTSCISFASCPSRVLFLRRNLRIARHANRKRSQTSSPGSSEEAKLAWPASALEGAEQCMFPDG